MFAEVKASLLLVESLTNFKNSNQASSLEFLAKEQQNICTDMEQKMDLLSQKMLFFIRSHLGIKVP